MRFLSSFTARQVWGYMGVLLAFAVPYTVGWAWGWWKFPGASIVVVLLWRWAKPNGAITDLGIRFCRADLGLALLSLLVVGTTARLLIPIVLQPHGYILGGSDTGWMYLAVPFQTLNEEMVLRALLLTALAQIVKVRLMVSATVAAAFMVLHLLLYRFGPPHTALSVQSLATLFLAGFAFNELFLATGSIAVPFAIHLGWNLTRFGYEWIEQRSSEPLQQGMDFNLIEGDYKVIGLSVALALIAEATRFRAWKRLDTLQCPSQGPRRK